MTKVERFLLKNKKNKIPKGIISEFEDGSENWEEFMKGGPEKKNLELRKERGLREFWEGYIDDVWFIYTPPITQQEKKIHFIVPEDPDIAEKINDSDWRGKAYLRIMNSINYGNKWKKGFHKRTGYNKYNGHQLKWRDDQISIKELNDD